MTTVEHMKNINHLLKIFNNKPTSWQEVNSHFDDKILQTLNNGFSKTLMKNQLLIRNKPFILFLISLNPELTQDFQIFYNNKEFLNEIKNSLFPDSPAFNFQQTQSLKLKF
jgi:hypothetical protein